MGTKDIRNLLLDCRAALRKGDGEFQHTTLCEQIDRSIIDLGEVDRAQQAAAREQDQLALSHQVAHAWQTAARELRHSHPELYSELSRKVLQRLDARLPNDPAEEIDALRTQLQQREAALASAAADLDSLRATLAAAMPLPGTPCEDQAALARQRVQALLQAAMQGGLAQAAPIAAANEEGPPTPASLQPVAEGLRTLTTAEREWCIGEAMVLTNFGRTPTELLSRGDAALAKFVLAAMARYA